MPDEPVPPTTEEEWHPPRKAGITKTRGHHEGLVAISGSVQLTVFNALTTATLVEFSSGDDLGSPFKSVETIQFGLDGAYYEINLSKTNAKALRRALAEFVAHARELPEVRRSARKPPVRRRPRSTVDNVSAATIREWAKASGVNVSARGKVPAEVTRAYEDAAKRRR